MPNKVLVFSIGEVSVKCHPLTIPINSSIGEVLAYCRLYGPIYISATNIDQVSVTTLVASWSSVGQISVECQSGND